MLRNRLYYLIKPLLPQGFRLWIRRWWTQRQRRFGTPNWPIAPGSEQPPRHWEGWPGGRKFAFVLTHDVEGQAGLDRVRDLMRLEIELGFRSSFNFIPKGEYQVPQGLLEELQINGFEVGVHDFNHDGYLYHSREGFAKKTKGINQALRDWGAVGFRSGFMLNRLDWFHDLDVEYDASTFDTDPFEPQPDGQHTIFPFWVGKEKAATPYANPSSRAANGYMELPYTLPQDSTLFLLLQETSPEIWMRKLDWIAEHRGMALLDTHPDYMDFNGKGSASSFPIRFYRQFLEYIRTKYKDTPWYALPREVARHAKNSAMKSRLSPVLAGREDPPTADVRPAKIWIDLDNTPHIPFFRPLIRELEARGHEVMLTARDAYQVCEMADTYGLKPKVVGRHYGKHPLRKFLGFLYRAWQLLPVAKKERPSLALNHGSRSQVFLSKLLGIPAVTIMDYEHGKGAPLARPKWMIVPEYFPAEVAGMRAERVLRYSGIKEDVYAPEFMPDNSILSELGVSDATMLVTVRPPASEAHYHNAEGEELFAAFVNRVCVADGVAAVLLPRNKRQEEQIRRDYPQWFKHAKVIIPAKVVNGLNLLWHSDLVVSGGGTMNREAAALGVPVYSIFRGKSAAVDRRLQEEGRLVLIESVERVHSGILLRRREKGQFSKLAPHPAMQQIIGHIENILKAHDPSRAFGQPAAISVSK